MSPADGQFPPQTRFFTIATAGHVDHGKTSLIKTLTGIDPDRLKEEKERQMTIDLGFANLSLSDHMIVGFVDVPGHGKFLKNMLAGVGGIDMALLVVAADEGPMPQTVQHVRILSLLGVRKAILAVTKVDMVEDQAQVAIVQEEAEELLLKHDIEVLAACPISSTKQTGFAELKTALSKVLSALPERDRAGHAFLPVDRVFSKSGFGVVVTGTLVRGRLAPGDQVTIEPGAIPARVRRLETFGYTVDAAGPGQRLACNLVLKEEQQFTRGKVVTTAPLASARQLIVSIIDKPRISGEHFAAISGQPIRFYHGTAECHGFLRWIDNVSEQANCLEAVGMIALSEPAVVQAKDRYVIRLSDETIYGGEVLISERPRWMHRGALAGMAHLLMKDDYQGALVSFVESGAHQMVPKQLTANFLPDSHQARTIQELLSQARIFQLGEYLVSTASRADLSKRLFEQVKQGAETQESGVPLEVVRSRMPLKLDRLTFQQLLSEEEGKGLIARKSDRVCLPPDATAIASDPSADPTNQLILQTVLSGFCLELDAVARTFNCSAAKAKSAVQLLAKSGQIHLINYEFAISDENLKKAHRILSNIWNQKRNISPTDFREELGTTRKYAMALLQHFDDSKVTRRLDSGRVLLKAPQT